MRYSIRSVSLVCALCFGLRAFCQIPQVNSVTGVQDDFCTISFSPA